MPTLSTNDYELPDIDGWVARDSRRLDFTVVVADGTPKNLTGDEIEWFLTEKPYETKSEAVISTDDADVTLLRTGAVDETQGEFRVDVDETAVGSAWGEHYQHVIINPQDDTRQSWRGDVTVVADD